MALQDFGTFFSAWPPSTYSECIVDLFQEGRFCALGHVLVLQSALIFEFRKTSAVSIQILTTSLEQMSWFIAIESW